MIHLELATLIGYLQPPPSTAAQATALETAPVDHGESAEWRRIEEALERCGGNQTCAAELLGISRRTLVTRIGEHGLRKPRKPPAP